MELFGDLLRGHTDSIILSILEKEDSYGYEINSTISKISDGKMLLTEATLYQAFRRIEKAGYITSYWRDGLNQTKRRYYSITDLGKKVLKEKQEEWVEIKKIIDKFLLKKDSM